MKRIEDHINLGRWTEEELNGLLRKGSQIAEAGKRIDFISRIFLGVQYGESTLIGDEETAEALVINLGRVDCFTFLDYVEAMRLSRSFDAFTKTLRKVRYRSGRVSYRNRNHFFTDWREYRVGSVVDVSGKVGGNGTQTVEKVLNVKEDGTRYLPAIVPLNRRIDYIPASAIDEVVLGRLHTGDYVGIYSECAGLDVSHVGIIIREGTTVRLRHASSLAPIRKVIDQDFLEYMTARPGFLILRPRDSKRRVTGNRS